MTADEIALGFAQQVWEKSMSFPLRGHARTAVYAACQSYYLHMIALTPGLCVHEADGTVRTPTNRDI